MQYSQENKKTPTQVSSCEYCGISKVICFEEHLRMAASIRCYFDMINLKQSGFCTAYFWKFLQNKNIKTISKTMNLKKKKKKKKKICDSHMHVYVYVMFYYEKWKSVFLKFVSRSHSKNIGPVTRGCVKSSQMMNEIPLQL